MKILAVTTAYPSDANPTWAIFVKEQVDSLRMLFPDLVIDVLVIDGSNSKYEYFRAIRLVSRIIKEGDYDVVHAHFGLTLLSLIFVSVPLVITFHGSDLLVRPGKYLCKLLARKASRCIVVSKGLRDELGYGDVIPCGIDVERFLMPFRHRQTSARARPDCLRILFPSDPVVKVKDYGLFDAACQELERRGKRVERIHLMNIQREDVPEIYWSCDLMLLTSLSEGSPTVIKEAIAAKLPFVSVDVGDVKEWAELVEFGDVVEDREPKTIADAATTLLARIEHRHLLDNGRCLRAMDIGKVSEQLMRVYDELLRPSI